MKRRAEQGEALPRARQNLQPEPRETEATTTDKEEANSTEAVLDAGYVASINEALQSTEAQLARCTDVQPGRAFPMQFTTATANLSRRLDDQHLLDHLARQEFAGPVYEVFQAELIAYGFPVLMDWMYTGKIFALCAARGRGLSATDRARQALREAQDDREELAYETIARGLRLFRQDALINGGWRFEGGASLKTFFVGALLLCFANAYRIWLRDHEHWASLADAEQVPSEEHLTWELPGTDPAALVVDNLTVQDYLDGIADPLTRAAAALALADLPRKQIGDQLELSTDAVNMRLSRLRQSTRRTSNDGPSHRRRR